MANGLHAADGPSRLALTVAGVALAVLAFATYATAQANAARPEAAGGPPCKQRYVVATDGAPEAIGPYSQAVGAGETLYLSGQIPMDPDTGEVLRDESIATQTHRVLSNLQAVLEAAGLTLDDVVATSVFLTDLDDFQEMNVTYATFFGDEPPARATVEVPRLPADVHVEISAVAYARCIPGR